jgi:hypothetical protein
MSSSNNICAYIYGFLLGCCITLLVYAYIFFTTTNNLQTYLNVYSGAIANYQAAGTADRMMSSSATLHVFNPYYTTQSMPMSLAAIPVNMSGPNAPIPLPVEVFTATTWFPTDNLTTYNLTIQYSSTASATAAVPTIMPSQQLRTAKVKCYSRYGCSADEMREKCQGATCPQGVQFGGPGNADNGQELTCIYMTHVPYVCRVITKATDGSNRWVWSTDYEYCDWPFNVPARVCGYDGNTLPFQIRTDDDPYVILSKITHGNIYFGITSTMQRIYGGLCLAGGLILAVLLIGCFWAVCCGCKCPSFSRSSSSYSSSSTPYVPVSTATAELNAVSYTDPAEDYQPLAHKDFTGDQIPEADLRDTELKIQSSL